MVEEDGARASYTRVAEFAEDETRYWGRWGSSVENACKADTTSHILKETTIGRPTLVEETCCDQAAIYKIDHA